ncbi:hypothetical protein [Dongia deserti]|uniref:hypothetical protein n=1 Tax=Dongia deserti TaxID=2268030 RepID=UPI000E6476C4|nr:hypothetical protein [Dongia deserti]
MPSPAVRILIAFICIASGVVPMLAAFDLGPLDSSAINGPRWLGFLAGAVFVAAGIALVLGERLQRSVLASGFFALVIGSFAAIGNWIAFGPGPRECTIAMAGFLLDSYWANAIACRAGFGIGALLLDGIVLWMIAASLRTILGPGALPTFVEKVGVTLMLLVLAPILLPMLLFGIGRILLESFATWRATGRWPRNEAFIRRMKAKRATKP